MRSITLQAPGKINLTLDVSGVLPDGYHEIETIFQSVDVFDEMRISVRESDQLSVQIDCERDGAPCPDFPLDDSNLIARSARAFAAEAGCGSFAAEVSVNKRLPIGGGMAGGSANGAAMLIGLNLLFQEPFSREKLLTIGSKLGADVPFCMMGATMLGRGKGDKLTPLESKCALSLCLVKPRKLSVSTAWVYEQFDLYPAKVLKPNTPDAIKALAEGDFDKLIRSLGNAFQPLVFKHHPQLQEIYDTLYDLGSWYVQMTGSGPTLFSIVASREMAHSVRRRMLRSEDDGFLYGSVSPTMKGPPWDFFIAESIDHGIRHETVVG
jgi:4-diphosphocytidyl-2-C-methyl-D-erythritol kinase